MQAVRSCENVGNNLLNGKDRNRKISHYEDLVFRIRLNSLKLAKGRVQRRSFVERTGVLQVALPISKLLHEFSTEICAEKISLFLLYVMMLSVTFIYGVEGRDGNRTLKDVAGSRHAPKGQGLPGCSPLPSRYKNRIFFRKIRFYDLHCVSESWNIYLSVSTVSNSVTLQLRLLMT